MKQHLILHKYCYLLLENSVPAAHHPITSIRNIKIKTTGKCLRSENLASLCRGRQTQGHCAQRKYDVAEIENIKTIIDLSHTQIKVFPTLPFVFS